MDVLDDILSSLRLTGGVVIDAEFTGDYCVGAEFTPNHCAPWFPMPQRLISYHYVRSGRTLVQVGALPPVLLEAGSIVILPRNEPHRLASGPGLKPADVGEISWITAEGVHRVSSGTPGEKTEIWCGFLGTASPSGHPLIDALPPLLTLNVAGQQAQWLESSLRFLAEARPSPEVVAKMAELFLAQAIREYLERLPPGSKGWLRGLTDPAVSRALSIIHSRYAEDLDVETLAREAGVSRTVLGERFTELLGESPMRYCAKWRMRTAANLLREGKQNSATIAYAVGFNSEAAFNRAFKREYGEPPATWRKRSEMRRVPLEEEPEVILAAAMRSERTGSFASKDGTAIGFSDMGEGFPLVMPSVWFHQIESDGSSPVWRHWMAEAVRDRRLVRSDVRGAGRSGRHPPRWTLEALCDDFAAVVDGLELEQFDIMSFSHSSLVAIHYAARHPDRVRKLVMIGGYAKGYAVRGDQEEIRRRETLIEFARNYKGGEDGTTFAQMLGALYWPSARGETVDWFGKRLATIVGLDEALMDVFRNTDLDREVPEIRAETLIMHSFGDRIINCSCSEQMAEMLPAARFVPLDSDSHVLFGTEPAWEAARRELRTMLDAAEDEPAALRRSA
ncbi:MAG: alpha/beta fold hydrolase [Sphingomonas sp.]